MPEQELIFVIPTYRLRDVCETVETYDENFWNNGHSPRIIVFDDSSVANHEKYYPLLEKTRTWNDVFYVGPKEKEAFSTSSTSGCATGSSSPRCATSSGRATAATATSRSSTRSAATW